MVRFRQPWLFVCGRSTLAAVALLAIAASGCKSGSWASRPSWLGGSSPSASALSAAPSFDGGIAKPSETAKPYPTTNTPEGYVLSDSTRTGGAAAMPAAAPLEPSAVTYGSAPPAASTAAAPQNPAAPSAVPAPASNGIGPQVGPYASLQPPADPAAAVTAGLGAAPAFGEAAPPLANTAPPAAERMADARTPGWAPTQPTQPMNPGFSQDSRYGATTTSRFSGGGYQPPTVPGPSADPSLMPPPAAANPMLPVVQPAPAQPVADPSAPATTPGLPGGIQPPVRRPDPGYRPGGTSNYRPARSLLAAEDDASAVQPAGFTAP